jgi:hypothetical protein
MIVRFLTVLAALALGTTGCGTSTLEILSPGGDSGSGGVITLDAAGATAPDGGMIALDGGGTLADFCSGSGSPILVSVTDSGGAAVCAGGLAQSAFRWALCTCDGLVSQTSITTDSFDGSKGGYDAGSARAGGGLGTNGNLSAQGTLTIGGALWVADATGMTVATASAQGELHAAGRVASGPSLAVGGDVYVLGDIAATGDLHIGGTLHQPAGAAASAGGTKSIGATATGSFTVPPACDCDPALLIDVASYVEAYRANNDDAAVGIDPDVLANVTSDTTLTLPCGRIFLTRVGGTAAIDLTLSAGRTAIFVGGDLSPQGPFAVHAPAGSEVDLFVEGGVAAGASFAFGNPDYPSKARLWLGGTATTNFPSASLLAGNVYAPRSQLVLGTSSVTTVFGSIFASRVSAQGALTIHYDESVLSAGETCGGPSGPCSSCHDCGNQACVAGTCGACTDSSGCCAPLVCDPSSGRCLDVIP